MNFSPLQLRKPALAALGERAENLFRDHHYRECTQVMRQFAEGVLRTILKDDRHTYSEMMRTPFGRTRFTYIISAPIFLSSCLSCGGE